MPRTSREMSLWLRREEKAQPPGLTSYGYGGGPAYSDAFRSRRAPSLPALAEAYKSLIFTCVRLNADAVARVPLRLIRVGDTRGDRTKHCNARLLGKAARERLHRLGDTAKAMAGAAEVEEITGDFPLLNLIETVNPVMDRNQLIAYTVMSMDVVGTGFWWPTEFLLGCPREFWALPPHLVYPIMDGSGLVPTSYQFGAQQYAPEDLLIFKQLSMKNPYALGMSPTQAAIEYARLEDTFVSIQDDLLSNGPRPSVIVSPKDGKTAFGAAERRRLEEDMNHKGRGGRSGSAFVVDGAVAVTPVSWTPADLGSIEISKYDLERIAGCFGVPVSMLTNESSNRAVAEAGLEQHARQAVDPRCKAIASALTRWTHALDRTGQRNWRKLFWVFDDVVPEDKESQADLHTKYFAMGLPTNRILTDAGYDPVEGGDVSLVPNNLATLESVLKGPAKPEEPGKPAATDDEETPDTEPEDDEEAGTKALMDLCGKVLGAIDADLKGKSR